MKFRFSRCLAVQVPDLAAALAYYHNQLGLEIIDQNDDGVELGRGPGRLFLEEGGLSGPVAEFLTDDLAAAREYLKSAGCEEIVWEGPGGRCYLKDPFGVIFNVFEEQSS
ncbi:MAG: VOC family protein [Candidatus Neomarinimicrobiota bacterium]